MHLSVGLRQNMHWLENHQKLRVFSKAPECVQIVMVEGLLRAIPFEKVGGGGRDTCKKKRGWGGRTC